MDDQMGVALRRAGSAAVEVNAPLGDARRAGLVAWLADRQPARTVDLGCGHGALLIDLALASDTGHGHGVDIDPAAIAVARERAAAAHVEDRTTWTVGEATAWSPRTAGTTDPCDAVITVGVGHVFGGAPGLLSHLRRLLPDGGAAVVGIGVWTRRPDRWCRDTFGALLRPDDLVDLAEMEGWTVEDIELSTVEEWDAFEAAWNAGVEAVGSPEAAEFVEQRRLDYARYRGVLGMAWLQLTR